MEDTKKTLIETYSRKDTEELLSLHKSEHLTSEAYDALESVLKGRGIEPLERPTLSQKDKEETPAVRWGNFWPLFFGAFALCVIAHRIFLANLPNPANVMPGSLRDIVGNLLADSVEFIIVFLLVSIPIVVFSKLRTNLKKHSVSRLLNIALIVTLFIECLIIFGAWLIAER
jgi:hypothetical protein